jgi:hypothetical protein
MEPATIQLVANSTIVIEFFFSIANSPDMSGVEIARTNGDQKKIKGPKIELTVSPGDLLFPAIFGDEGSAAMVKITQDGQVIDVANWDEKLLIKKNNFSSTKEITVIP